MNAIGVMGMTVSQVMGCGAEKGKTGRYRGVSTTMNLYRKVQVDIVVSTVDPGLVVAAARKALNTEHYGDGKIFSNKCRRCYESSYRRSWCGSISLQE